MRLVSINVNGLKAFYEKGAFDKLVSDFQPDILCMQETKCSESNVGYWIADHNYTYSPFSSSNHWKHGYAGVTTLVKEHLLKHIECIHHPQLMDEYGEGRVVVVEFKKFFLINVYTLNSGDKDELRVEWDIKFRQYIYDLQLRKPVIIVGDMNVVPSELDYWGNFDAAVDTMPGLKTYEKEGFFEMCEKCDLVDTFRELSPQTRSYSWYSYRGGARSQNKGWRIDFALISRSVKNWIQSSQVFSNFEGSDHCPIMIEL